MIHVALFRNLNLGHRGSPTGNELLAAFGDASRARTFQTNGTVLFKAAHPERTAQRALHQLRAQGYQHQLVIRALPDIADAVRHLEEPDPAENIYRTMISFFDTDELPKVRLPARSPDRLVELRRLEPGYAVSVCWKPGSKAGDVTGFLESVVDAPATTRSLGTVERLLSAGERLDV